MGSKLYREKYALLSKQLKRQYVFSHLEVYNTIKCNVKKDLPRGQTTLVYVCKKMTPNQAGQTQKLNLSPIMARNLDNHMSC